MSVVMVSRADKYWVEVGISSCVLTEGMSDKLPWEIGARMTFRYDTTKYDACSADLRRFIEQLEKLTPSYFVVSFQYENVYAIRDKSGLRVLEKF
jgi:hypothetical protein